MPSYDKTYSSGYIFLKEEQLKTFQLSFNDIPQNAIINDITLNETVSYVGSGDASFDYYFTIQTGEARPLTKAALKEFLESGARTITLGVSVRNLSITSQSISELLEEYGEYTKAKRDEEYREYLKKHLEWVEMGRKGPEPTWQEPRVITSEEIQRWATELINAAKTTEHFRASVLATVYYDDLPPKLPAHPFYVYGVNVGGLSAKKCEAFYLYRDNHVEDGTYIQKSTWLAVKMKIFKDGEWLDVYEG